MYPTPPIPSATPAAIHPTPELRNIAANFLVDGELVEVRGWEGGHINDSYLLTFVSGRGRSRFLLQRVNGEVFPQPRKVMENVRRVTEFVGKRAPGLAFLQMIPTLEGNAWHEDSLSDCWRLYPFIEGTTTRLEVETVDQAKTAALAFGHFTRLLSDLPDPPLHEVIPGFHDTPQRLATLATAAARDSLNRTAAAADDIEFVLDHSAEAGKLMALLSSGELPRRVVHNDTKISNVLLDQHSNEAVCVVDLDTVMPGTALFDFGDMLRSMCTRAPEDERDLSKVVIDGNLCNAIHQGYLDGTGTLLTPLERELMPFAGFIIALELGARFLADHLSGDHYFRIQHRGQNLDRARVQLAIARALSDRR